MRWCMSSDDFYNEYLGDIRPLVATYLNRDSKEDSISHREALELLRLYPKVFDNIFPAAALMAVEDEKKELEKPGRLGQRFFYSLIKTLRREVARGYILYFKSGEAFPLPTVDAYDIFAFAFVCFLGILIGFSLAWPTFKSIEASRAVLNTVSDIFFLLSTVRVSWSFRSFLPTITAILLGTLIEIVWSPCKRYRRFLSTSTRLARSNSFSMLAKSAPSHPRLLDENEVDTPR
ncbi:hypothetical protein BC829DRAFT_387023 [Chytridium lagenaria]|nr:hypothetical protein BC829DRAFT_387023 [Chytridium lagenaria]